MRLKQDKAKAKARPPLMGMGGGEMDERMGH
jgi:hypothetical protein